MKKLGSPNGMLLFVSLPQFMLACVMGLLLLTKANHNAMWFLAAYVACMLASAVYAVMRRAQERVDSKAYIVVAAVFTVLLVAAVLLLDDSAMFDGFISARLLVMLLCSVSVVYSMLGLVSSTEGKGDFAKHLIGLAIVPLAFFLGFNLLSGAGFSTAVMILIIAFGYVSGYLLIKTIQLKKKQNQTEKSIPKIKGIALYAIFSVVLPLIGLALNLGMGHLFGDFSHPAFFVMPIVNGILLLTPPLEDRRLRLLRFFVLSAATTYLIYFVIVFIPYIPMGFFGLLIILGGLIFAPAAALVMQAIHIISEWKQLSRLWNAGRVLTVFLAGIVLLPTITLTSFIGDRRNLETAVSYLEQGAHMTNEPVNLSRLQRSIQNSGAVFQEERSLLDMPSANNNNIPIISWIYSDLVLDHRILAEDSIARLNRIFFNDLDSEAGELMEDGLTIRGNMHTSVKLMEATAETEYDEEISACRTWVNLTLQGPANAFNNEYVTTFSLPEGAYISDYYLDVFGERKKGILADKRAAMWIYHDIVNVNEDPGMLRYIKDNTLELRVFPFAENELRYTGFEVMHTGETTLCIDGQVINLPSLEPSTEVEVKGAVMLPAELKEMLPKAKQRPVQYYFVVDCSAHSNIAYQLSQIKEYAMYESIDEADVLFVSYRLEQESPLDNAGDIRVTTQGGFNLALAVRRILETNAGETVPVIIFTSGNPTAALHPEKISLLSAQYPESRFYYWLRADMKLTPYSLDTGMAGEPVEQPILSDALLYNGMRVKDNGIAELVRTGEASLDITGNQYQRAMMLDIASRSGRAQTTAESISLLRASFRANVLTPQTAFIVVETPLQEQLMLEKQEKLMEQDTALAAKESLDEPSLLICALILAFCGMCIALRRRKKAKKA